MWYLWQNAFPHLLDASVIIMLCKHGKIIRKSSWKSCHLIVFQSQLQTSSINCGILPPGLKSTSTLQVPPLPSKVIGWVGEILRIPGCCRAAVRGVSARENVIAAGLLFTIGMSFLTTLPTTWAPRFRSLCFGSATSIYNSNNTNKQLHMPALNITRSW